MGTSLITRSSCRICGSPLVSVLNLGAQRIAGAFAKDGSGAIERKVPLQLMRCDTSVEGACGLVQLRHTVPGAILYSSYWYRSGVNRTMTENLHGIARTLTELAGVSHGNSVLDIGCNDGTLLDGYDRGVRRVGFDPCDVAALAEDRHKVVRDFYTAERAGPGRYEAISSIAMFYDLEHPAGFVADIALSLKRSGVWCLELHYLPAMLASNGFDAIVHEHLCYYSLAVIERLLADAGLEVIRGQENQINGGSIRLYCGHRGAHQIPASEQANLRALRVAEFEAALDTPEPYIKFAREVANLRRELRDVCTEIVERGERIHVYGASTKGNTILQYCDLGPDVIEVAADRNPDKAGSETATGIPICTEERSRALGPDYYLVLPWHFMDEFLERERVFLEGGGKFIVPLPEVRVLDRSSLVAA